MRSISATAERVSAFNLSCRRARSVSSCEERCSGIRSILDKARSIRPIATISRCSAKRYPPNVSLDSRNFGCCKCLARRNGCVSSQEKRRLSLDASASRPQRVRNRDSAGSAAMVAAAVATFPFGHNHGVDDDCQRTADGQCNQSAGNGCCAGRE